MAPKKAAKKTAKKSPGKHDPHKSAKDARRTFEHLGRIHALSGMTVTESDTISAMTQLADAAFRAEQYKESADLLRAVEHLSFATVHSSAKESVGAELKNAITEEFQNLMGRMKDNISGRPAPKEVQPHLQRFADEAKAALRRGSYRAALEWARGAEALAHVHELGGKSLPSSAAQRRLPK